MIFIVCSLNSFLRHEIFLMQSKLAHKLNFVFIRYNSKTSIRLRSRRNKLVAIKSTIRFTYFDEFINQTIRSKNNSGTIKRAVRIILSAFTCFIPFQSYILPVRIILLRSTATVTSCFKSCSLNILSIVYIYTLKWKLGYERRFPFYLFSVCCCYAYV